MVLYIDFFKLQDVVVVNTGFFDNEVGMEILLFVLLLFCKQLLSFWIFLIFGILMVRISWVVIWFFILVEFCSDVERVDNGFFG